MTPSDDVAGRISTIRQAFQQQREQHSNDIAKQTENTVVQTSAVPSGQSDANANMQNFDQFGNFDNFPQFTDFGQFFQFSDSQA
jgi:hypothetical protein